MAAAPGFASLAPLPPNPFNQSPYLDAYDSCLQSQNEAGNDESRLMYARCLGHLLCEVLDDARNVLVDEINECVVRGTNIDQLAQFYINHLFRLFRQNKGHTPATSDHVIRLPIEKYRAFFSTAPEPVPKSHATAKHSALWRDNYRCLVTQAADHSTFRGTTVTERQKLGLTAHTFSTITHLCRIFPPSTNWDLNPEEHGHPKMKRPGNLGDIINCFGGINVLAELNDTNAHRLSNGLTMGTELHQLFDDLLLWFEAVPDIFNTYTVRTAFPFFVLGQFSDPHVVTFTTTAANLELPDPKYLGLHATVCRVAHMSGAARYLSLRDQEVEERQVLAYDGSSADLLASRLTRVALTA